jgi:hypothetical protein
MSRAAIVGWLAVCIWLMGCQSAAEPSVSSSTLTIEPAASTPEATARAFFQACAAGDQAAVLDLLAPLTRQAVVSSGSNPCRHVPPAGIDRPELHTETAGQTAYARYRWLEGETTATGELVLVQEDNVWLILDSQLTYHRPTRTPAWPAAPTLAPVVTGATRGTP